MATSSPNPKRKSPLHRGWSHALWAATPGKSDKHHTATVLRRLLVDSAQLLQRKMIEKLSKKFSRSAVESQLLQERYVQKRIIRSSTRIAAKVALDYFGIRDVHLRAKIIELLTSQRIDVELHQQAARERGLLHEEELHALLAAAQVNADKSFMPIFMGVYSNIIADVEGDKPSPRPTRSK